ncbi:MAG: hypothetical protein M3463_00190 [Verrucomicrobiota bacterium]|nr:hypothetical protein [Verrucomicrobiota bacterium]
MRIVVIVSLWICLLSPLARGSNIVLTFIYQPLTNFGTAQVPAVVIAKIPVLTTYVAESLVRDVARANRLVQDESANIDDSNILSRLGVVISVQLQGKRHYSVTLDLTRLGDPERFGVTARQVVESAVECIRRTIDETRLFHGKKARVTWELHIRSRPGDREVWKRYERRYEAAAPN